MTRRRISRRRFLRGMLGGAAVTVGLPALDIFLNTNGTAFANGSPLPTRFSLFFWGNGVLPEKWIPASAGMGDEWQLSEQLEPLAAVKQHISVLSGLNVKLPNLEPHLSGACGILTGGNVLPEDNTVFGGATVDQIIANEIGSATRFKSLEYGAEGGRGLSYNGPNNRNPPETSPMALFQRVFGGDFRLPGDDWEPDPRLALRRSVLDGVLDDVRSFEQELGASDRARLEQHLDGIRELETRIARLEQDPPDLAACLVPGAPQETYPDVDGRPQVREKNRALCDIAAYALACDQTRVMSNFISYPVNNLLIGAASDGHHNLTHNEPGEQPEVNEITKFYMEEFAYMIDRFRSIPEGDGTLLDHCGILGTTDVGYGRTHTLLDFPIVIAGSANGRFHTDMHYRSTTGENASEVILSLIRSMGINAASFGEDDGYTEDSFSPLEV